MLSIKLRPEAATLTRTTYYRSYRFRHFLASVESGNPLGFTVLRY